MGVLGLAQGLAFRARRCEPIPILKSALLRVARHYANQGPGDRGGTRRKEPTPCWKKGTAWKRLLKHSKGLGDRDNRSDKL